jgi:hypothetical protein
MPVANGFELERVSTRPKDRWNIYRWHLHEHIGTHLDAPLHCSTLDSGDRIPVERLVGPLAVVGGGEPGEPRASAAKGDDDHRGQPQDRGLHGRAQPCHRAFLRSRILQDGF